MRVLFVSGELIGASLCLRLKKEGCDVKLYIKDRSRKDCLDGMVEKVSDWKKELKWVGKDGLIVFDDVGYGKIQDELRKRSYRVVGGSAGGDMLEKDREYAQKVFKENKIDCNGIKKFLSLEAATGFIEKNKSRWVIKQNEHKSAFTYVGKMLDGSDTVDVLKSYNKYNSDNSVKTIYLQEAEDGIEIAVGRFFNGIDWVGPLLINLEHKPLLNNDVGPLTGEMGTLAWYDDNENNKLFQKTLAKLKDHLQSINHRGYVDINCIVNKNKIAPLELTMRFGCPTNQLQSEIHLSAWKEFLSAIADGKEYKLKYKKIFGIVVSVATPPFPYKGISKDYYLKDVAIFFKNNLEKKYLDKIHFDEVSFKEDRYKIAGSNGYILYVTETGKTMSDARKRVYNLIEDIIIPKMIYRTDIGLRFEKEEGQLKSWGWI